jgi:nucleoid-associated protein YgaU
MTSTPVAMAATSTGGAAGGSGDVRTTHDHASLRLHHAVPGTTIPKPGPEYDRIDFQFNPKDLTVAKAASWARKPAKDSARSGPPQYNGPEPSKLTLEMFFDASEKQDNAVVSVVDKLFSCCVPTDESLQRNQGSPPLVLFRWGTLTGFVAYVRSVSVKYTLFTATGTPIRAVCTVTLEEMAAEPSKQNPTSGGLSPHRVHVVTAGETLAGVAYGEYGDPARWRDVARVNEIDDPMRLRPGTRLLLPAPAELHRTPRRVGVLGDVEVARAR